MGPSNLPCVTRIALLHFRILWVVSFILSLTFCVYIVAPIVSKWDTDPTIISISDTNYPVWKVDFPAVTICSNNKVVGPSFEKALKKPP